MLLCSEDMDLLSELPWAIEHGALLWRVALAALVLGGAALGALARRPRRTLRSGKPSTPYREAAPLGAPPEPSVLRGASRGAALGAAAFTLVFVGGGELALRVAQKANIAALQSPGALLQFAAATPHRDRALAALEAALDSDRDPTPTIRRRTIAAQILHGHCGLAAGSLQLAGQHRRAAELLESCPHERASAAYPWLSIGEFGRAVRALENDPEHTRDREDVVYYVLADRPEASRVAREAAAAVRGERGTGTPSPREAHAISLECVADALDTRRGDADARGRLARRADEGGNLACQILFADLLDGPARLAQLARMPAPSRYYSHLRRALRREADPDNEWLDLREVGLHAEMPLNVLPALFGAAGYVALSNRLFIELEDRESLSPGDQASRFYAAASVATFEALAGSDRRAQHAAALALASVEALPETREMWHDPTSRGWGRMLAEDVDLRSGHPERVPGRRECHYVRSARCIAEYVRAHDASVMPTPEELRFSPEEGSSGLWATLARGDGAELIADVNTHPSSTLATFDVLLPLTLRLVGRNRAVVLDHVQWHRDALRTWYFHQSTLEEFAAAARWRARTARALGAQELAAESDADADRLRAAALRRDIAVVRAVLQWPEDYELAPR